MANKAKTEAENQLGSLNLSYLDQERKVAQDTAATSKKSLKSDFDTLLEQVESNRGTAKSSFDKGRGTVAEEAFDTNRLNNLDLSSRVSGSTGAKQLGEVGTRIETGRQYSDLANTYYDEIEDLDRTEKRANEQYEIDSEVIDNTLGSSLAGIDTRAGEARNQRNSDIASLTEQIQGRWDSNANAQASLAQAERAAAQSHRDAQANLKATIKSENRTVLNEILNMEYKNDDGSYTPASIDQQAANIQTMFNVDAKTAYTVLSELGLDIQGADAYRNTNGSYLRDKIWGYGG